MARDLNRRDLLAALLGAPALLAGCGRSEPPEPDFAGEIVGPAVDVGHRLCDGWHVTSADDAWRQTEVVIVGGGVAGLAAAWRLLRAGCDDFVLLELERTAGGTSRSETAPPGMSAQVAYPWGAHYIPAPTRDNPALIRLLDEMGIVAGSDADGQPLIAEQFLCRDPQERVFYRGRWYEGLYLHAGASAADDAERRRFEAEVSRWVAWRDGRGRRAFGIPTATASDDAELSELDRLSMAEWLQQYNFSSPRLRWLVDYACRDDYGLTVDQASAWAGLFYFASRVVRPGAESRPLVTWPAGNGRLVEHLARPLARQMQLGMTAVEIIPTGNDRATTVDVVAASGDGRSVRGYHAQRVIFAAPQFITPHVIRPWRTDPPPHVSQFQYGSWLVANLFLRNRPVSAHHDGFPLCWDNVLYESPSLGYVCATHQPGPEFGPTVLTYYYPFCDADPRRARERLLALHWRDCAELVLTDLAVAHPDLRGLVERIDVMRWGHAMIGPRPGFVTGPALRAAAQPFRGIHFANTDLSGVALFEEAFYHGLRAAEEVLTARGRPTKSLL